MKSHASRRAHHRKIVTVQPEDLIRMVTESVAARSMFDRQMERSAAVLERPESQSSHSGKHVTQDSPRNGNGHQEYARQSPETESKQAEPPVLIEPAPVASEPPVLVNTAPEPHAIAKTAGVPADVARVLAVFCFEDPESAVGEFVRGISQHIAPAGTAVHIFCRHDFEVPAKGVHVHALGDFSGDDIYAQAKQFAVSARVAFLNYFSTHGGPGAQPGHVTLMASEWPAIPAVLQLAKTINAPTLVSFQSLECQRSDMSSTLSHAIQEIELEGLRYAERVLFFDENTRRAAVNLLPACEPRIVSVTRAFPAHGFQTALDAGEIKARYLVGPVDPTILFIGDLDDSHGCEILMKSVPAILKNHPQARFVFVGEGTLLWPLRVYARYLLLEHAVRLAGHVEGQALQELIAAANIIVVPSRKKTEEWPILAGWAAGKPVVATHDVGSALIAHEQNGLLIYNNESSCVWGVERILFDPTMGARIGAKGREKLVDQYGWKRAAEQISEMLGLRTRSAEQS